MGGSFDPAHGGHLYVSDVARRLLKLDAVWWLVSPGNPLKPQPESLEVRLNRARLVARRPRFCVTGIEKQLGTRYTIDTVRELRLEYPQAQWFLIVGADQARRFQTWHEWEELLCLVHLVVAERDAQAGQWQNSALIQALRLPFEPIDISATAIRSRLAQGLPISGLDPKVTDYIRQHQLYTFKST